MITGKWLRPGAAIEDALRVRQAVFVEEQGFAGETERDALDEASWHAVLYEGEEPVATGRIYWAEGEFHVGRICVLRALRGRGYGDLLMRLLLYKALDHNAVSVTLGAQLHALPFYARYGFMPYGEEYLEEGVGHQRMRALAAEIRLESACGGGGCEGCVGCAEGGKPTP